MSIPDSVTFIASNAFAGCSNISKLDIGKGCKRIYSEAFANCPALTDVYCFAKNVPITNSNAFTNSNTDNATLHVPESSILAYANTKPWNEFNKYELIIIPTYTITYIVDGKEYKSYQIEEGEPLTPEPTPTKEGYSFSGWSEVPETMPAHDVTVTGSFTINKYTLTYIVDGEEYKTFEIEFGQSIEPEVEPEKEGYTFSGWSYIPKKMPAEDVVVTGTFIANYYTLTYVVDGAVYKSVELACDSPITPEAEPTKEGYTFSGWSWIPSKMPAEDVTVTGTFNINSYKLTYMIDDKVYKEAMYEYGTTITPEPQPEGSYATFEWTDLPQTMPAHDVVVYASYTTGIVDVLKDTQRNMRIYSPDGKS